MKRFAQTWFFVALLVLIACKKEATNPVEPQNPVPPGFEMPALNRVVMYEVNLRAFSQNGDIAGLEARLPDLARLGVNVLWLMPIHPVGELRSVGGLGSPYAVRDFRGIGAEYGNLADFKRLVTKAHAQGMAVLLDWVANHTAWDHPWITEHPSWYTQDAQGTIVHPPGTNWLDVADLNFNNADMRQAMVREMRYWTEEVGIDGFRCDAADFVPYSFWQQAVTELRTGSNRPLLLLAEGIRSNHFTAGFDLIFSWDYYARLKESFQRGQGTFASWNAHQLEYNQTPAGKHRLRFVTNHDEYAWDNTPSVLFGGDEAAFAAFALTSCWSPVVLIYNGQEIAWPQRIPFFTRSPLNWATKPAYRERYEAWMQLRRQFPQLYEGSLNLLQLQPLTVFSRATATDTLLVLINTRNQPDSLQLPDPWNDGAWQSIFGQATAPHRADAYGVTVWRRQ
jgi:glycosidase